MPRYGTCVIGSPTSSEYANAEFMAGGSYNPYLRRIRRVYARRVAAMSEAVRRYFPEETRLTRPDGGASSGCSCRKPSALWRNWER